MHFILSIPYCPCLLLDGCWIWLLSMCFSSWCSLTKVFPQILQCAVLVWQLVKRHSWYGMGEQEDDNTWVYGLIGICICIVFVMGMGVFSAVYFGIPGRVYMFKYKEGNCIGLSWTLTIITSPCCRQPLLWFPPICRPCPGDSWHTRQDYGWFFCTVCL